MRGRAVEARPRILSFDSEEKADVRTGARALARRARLSVAGGDAGLATTAVLVVTAVAVVAVLMLFVIPLISGTEQSSRAQTGADAAALAGAVSVRERARDELASVHLSDLALGETAGQWQFVTAVPPFSGFHDAQSYAAANGSTLSPAGYSYDPVNDRISVQL